LAVDERGIGEARTVISDLSAWHVVEPVGEDVMAGIDASKRWLVSFWDAMIIVAATKAGASVIWSEDLMAGQNYEGVVVRNPFTAGGEQFSHEPTNTKNESI
jgi:predicted nucleic acid-binding protein